MESRRETHAVLFMLWDEDTAAEAPGKSRSQQGRGEEERGSKACERAKLRI